MMGWHSSRVPVVIVVVVVVAVVYECLYCFEQSQILPYSYIAEAPCLGSKVWQPTKENW